MHDQSFRIWLFIPGVSLWPLPAGQRYSLICYFVVSTAENVLVLGFDSIVLLLTLYKTLSLAIQSRRHGFEGTISGIFLRDGKCTVSLSCNFITNGALKVFSTICLSSLSPSLDSPIDRVIFISCIEALVVTNICVYFEYNCPRKHGLFLNMKSIRFQKPWGPCIFLPETDMPDIFEDTISCCYCWTFRVRVSLFID